MNRADLINEFRDKANISKQEANSIVNIFFGEMSNALTKDQRVEIRGLCSLTVRQYKAYAGRNPKTGKSAKVKAKKLPFFKCGAELKKRLNSK